MLKAKTGDGDLILGLSELNMQKLKEGQPIVILESAIGKGVKRIVIFYGPTEDIMETQLAQHGVVINRPGDAG